MKKLTLFIAILLIAEFANAQIIFQKLFGSTGFVELAYSIEQTTDSGFIIVGSTSIWGGYSDAYIIKTNAYGDTLWTRTFGGSDHDVAFSGHQTLDSGYIFSGYTASFSTGNPLIYLIRTDANGNMLWTSYIDGTNSSYYSPSVQQTTDGGYIVAGSTNSFGAGGHDIFVRKMNANGIPNWTRTWGGPNKETACSIQQTIDGGFVIIGYTLSFGVGSEDVYLIKIDSSGTLLWSKTFGGTGDDRGMSIQQISNGEYIIAGSTNSFGSGNNDVYLIKTDANGNLLWSKTFGGTSDDSGYSIEQTSDGGFIITGFTNSFGSGDNDVYIIKTDINGDTLWTKTFGGGLNDAAWCGKQTMDGGYIITGIGSFNQFSGIYLIKTDTNGNSGCNEANSATIVNIPTSQVTSPLSLVSGPPTLIAVPTANVGSGGISTSLCTNTGIHETPVEYLFSISPNPSKGYFIISFEQLLFKGNIEISNILGRNVFAENILNVSQKEINLKTISSGIYFVKVFNGEKIYCKKLIVE